MGLYRYEEAILDMLDAGMTQNQVAQRGYSYGEIERTINAIGTAERHARGDERRASALRKGSQALLRAIRQAKLAEGRAA